MSGTTIHMLILNRRVVLILNLQKPKVDGLTQKTITISHCNHLMILNSAHHEVGGQMFADADTPTLIISKRILSLNCNRKPKVDGRMWKTTTTAHNSNLISFIPSHAQQPLQTGDNNQMELTQIPN